VLDVLGRRIYGENVSGGCGWSGIYAGQEPDLHHNTPDQFADTLAVSVDFTKSPSARQGAAAQ
jgi:hypothetical protein